MPRGSELKRSNPGQNDSDSEQGRKDRGKRTRFDGGKNTRRGEKRGRVGDNFLHKKNANEGQGDYPVLQKEPKPAPPQQPIPKPAPDGLGIRGGGGGF